MSTRSQARYKNDLQTAALRLLKQLRGETASPLMNKRTEILKEATPAFQKKRQAHFERCRERFAKVCSRVERIYGPFSSTALDHMAQAMPDGVYMPIYFHNARWKYQFARNDMRQSSGDNPQVQQALASIRKEQAARLRRIRKISRTAGAGAIGLTYDKEQAKQDSKLISAFNGLRFSMRNEALTLMKKSRQPNNVIPLPVGKAKSASTAATAIKLA